METFMMNCPVTTVSILKPLEPFSSDLLFTTFSEDVKLEKLSRSETADKLLQELDKIKNETEPFYDWLDTEKTIQFPIFEDFSLPSFSSTKHEFEINSFRSCTTPNLYSQEQNFLYDACPPASPAPPTLPRSQDAVCNNIYRVDSKNLTNVLIPPENHKEDEILKFLQELKPEELEKMICPKDNETNMSESSLVDEEFSDNVCSPFVSSDSGIDDPTNSPVNFTSFVDSEQQIKKKRPYKPYSRVPADDKKLRKKEQNKNAATRYRLKKKAEIEVVVSEETQLEEKNKMLRDQFDEIAREVKCLKSLMKDLYKAKGLIK